ncbi:type 1 periplasmic binding fold superfamily protein [Rhodocytophaga rosea]|uniref:Type 1 periplasmic binding fold superfamily protein n=1 Tax=Rhodocytophaga rosea TaxID=2704465 RepID=A0A6C0GP84_9BACT|nr:type 1 periplasmic binding fold superfamily protein [Rhodocytophaga rosea]QHT69855.1 type 1 periplasmic binding fold superfamily protein [Rhodocytophaga rosea]
MLRITKHFLLLVLFSFLVTSCDKDEENPIEENEEELITTVKLTLTNKSNASETVTATWKDPEGDGSPIITGLTLKPGTTYDGRIEFLDESNPANVKDITDEIEKEGDAHEIFYTVTGAAMNVNKTDADNKGFPLGLTTTFTAATTSSGTLTITLKHKPDGLKQAGDDINVGSTDAEPVFPVSIQ